MSDQNNMIQLQNITTLQLIGDIGLLRGSLNILIQSMKLLSESFKVGIGAQLKASRLQEKGISSVFAIKVFVKGFDKIFTKFDGLDFSSIGGGGGSGKQSKSGFSGTLLKDMPNVIKSLKDTFKNNKNTLKQGAFQALGKGFTPKARLQGIGKIMKSPISGAVNRTKETFKQGAFETFGKGFTPKARLGGIGKMIKAPISGALGGGVAKGIGGAMMGGISSLGPQMLALSLVMKPIGALLEGIMEPLEPITDLFGAVGEILGTLLIPIVNDIMKVFMPLLPILIDVVKALNPVIAIMMLPLTLLGNTMQIVGPAIGVLSGWIADLMGGLTDVIDFGKGFLSDLSLNIGGTISSWGADVGSKFSGWGQKLVDNTNASKTQSDLIKQQMEKESTGIQIIMDDSNEIAGDGSGKDNMRFNP